MQAIAKGPLVCYPLRLKPGQELRSELLEFVKKNGLRSAFILSCCGSVTKAKLRLAEKGDGMDIKTFNDHFEIVSLVGTLSGGEGHLHISLSNAKGEVIGGHVIGDLYIWTTAEVIIGECGNVTFDREIDNATGYDELVIKPL